jgi:hypothetical protein
MKNSVGVCGVLVFFASCSPASSRLDSGASRGDDDSRFEVTRFADFDVRTGDRHYAASVLESIFGTDQQLYGDFPSTPKPEPIRTYVRERMSAFGGPCSVHEDFATRSLNGNGHPMLPTNRGCFFSDTSGWANVANPDTQVKSFVPPNTLASAWLHQTCSFLLGVQTPSQNTAYVDRALSNAIRRARGQSSIAVVDFSVAPSASDLDGAYQLFFPGREMSSELAASLENLVTQAIQMSHTPDPRVPASGLANREAWRFVLLSLCQSGLWLAP